METTENKVNGINAARNLKKVRTEESTSVQLEEGVGGLMSDSLGRKRWTEARLEKI